MTKEEFLKAVERGPCEDDLEILRLRKLVTEQAGMLDEAMAVFDRYLNVPESVALRKRWESFKNQPL